MFGSNVAPRVKKHPKKVAWFCELCKKPIKAYHSKCPTCGNTRPE